MALEIHPVPCLADNYAWLLRDPASGETAVCDPGEAAPVLAALQERTGGRCDWILLTHHHGDHIGGAQEVAAATGARIVGHAADATRLPPLDLALSDGQAAPLGGRILATPGHTRGHVAYVLPTGPALLAGDTLFALGCGRLFEGTAEELFASFRRFDDLPDETLLCCGHEYTEGNLRFALHLAPGDPALLAAAARIAARRAAGQPTVPTTLGEERALNPFLRAPDAATLGKLRALKDAFRG